MNVVTNRQLASSVALIAGLAIAVVAFAPPAAAQGIGGGGVSSINGGKTMGRAPSVSQPSALPGSQVSTDRVIPADKNAVDMSPNDALFDAITRGDIAAAQDAINRGADFNARNVLGLTPLDESIDLGRNNITFLLLSLRGGVDTTAAQAGPAKPASARPLAPTASLATPTATAMAPSPTAPSASDNSASAILTRGSAAKGAASDTQTGQQTSGASAAPASGSAGTPNPKSGFNGFGG